MKMNKFTGAVLAGASMTMLVAGPLHVSAYPANSWIAYEDDWGYTDASGNWVRNCWYQLGGKWYWMTEAGIAQKGWMSQGENFYYLGKHNKDGMQTGWQTIDGSTYYFGSNGVMKRGWQKIGNEWYFFKSDGKLMAGDQYLCDGYFYNFDDNGHIKYGWDQKENGFWRYSFPDGTMAVDTRVTIDGKTYTFTEWAEAKR